MRQMLEGLRSLWTNSRIRRSMAICLTLAIVFTSVDLTPVFAAALDSDLKWEFTEEKDPFGFESTIILDVEELKDDVWIESIELPNGEKEENSSISYVVDENDTYDFIVHYKKEKVKNTKDGEETVEVAQKKRISCRVTGLSSISHQVKEEKIPGDESRRQLVMMASPSVAHAQIDAIGLPDGEIVDGDIASYLVTGNGTYTFQIYYHSTLSADDMQKATDSSAKPATGSDAVFSDDVSGGPDSEATPSDAARPEQPGSYVKTVSYVVTGLQPFIYSFTESETEEENQVRIHLTVEPSHKFAEILGIILPDGTKVESSEVDFVTDKTGDFGFEVLYREQNESEGPSLRLRMASTSNSAAQPESRVLYYSVASRSTGALTITSSKEGEWNYMAESNELGKQIVLTTTVSKLPDINGSTEYDRVIRITADTKGLYKLYRWPSELTDLVSRVNKINDYTIEYTIKNQKVSTDTIDPTKISLTLQPVQGANADLDFVFAQGLMQKEAFREDPRFTFTVEEITPAVVSKVSDQKECTFLTINEPSEFVMGIKMGTSPTNIYTDSYGIAMNGFDAITTALSDGNMVLSPSGRISRNKEENGYNNTSSRQFLYIPLTTGRHMPVDNFEVIIPFPQAFTANTTSLGNGVIGWKFAYDNTSWTYQDCTSGSFSSSYNQSTSFPRDLKGMMLTRNPGSSNPWVAFHLLGDASDNYRLKPSKAFSEYTPGVYEAAIPAKISYNQLVNDGDGTYSVQKFEQELGNMKITVPDLQIQEVRKMSFNYTTSITPVYNGSPYMVSGQDESDLYGLYTIYNKTSSQEKDQKKKARTYTGGTVTMDVPEAFDVRSIYLPTMYTAMSRLEYMVRNADTGVEEVKTVNSVGPTVNFTVLEGQKVTQIKYYVSANGEGLSEMSVNGTNFRGSFTDPGTVDGLIFMPITFSSPNYVKEDNSLDDEVLTVRWKYSEPSDSLNLSFYSYMNSYTPFMNNAEKTTTNGYGTLNMGFRSGDQAISIPYKDQCIDLQSDGNEIWLKTLSGNFNYAVPNVMLNKGDAYLEYTTNLNTQERRYLLPQSGGDVNLNLAGGEYLTSLKLHYEEFRLKAINDNGSTYRLLNFYYGDTRSYELEDGTFISPVQNTSYGMKAVTQVVKPDNTTRDISAKYSMNYYMYRPTSFSDYSRIGAPASIAQGEVISENIVILLPYYTHTFYNPETAQVYAPGTKFYLPIGSTFRYAGSDPRTKVEIINNKEYLVYDMAGMPVNTDSITIPGGSILCLRSTLPGQNHYIFEKGYMDFGPQIMLDYNQPNYYYFQPHSRMEVDTEGLTAGSGVVYNNKRLYAIASTQTHVVAATSDTLYIFAGVDGEKESMSGVSYEADNYNKLYTEVPLGSDIKSYTDYKLVYYLPQKGVVQPHRKPEYQLTSQYSLYPENLTDSVSIKIKYKRSGGTWEVRNGVPGTDFTVRYLDDNPEKNSSAQEVSSIQDAAFVEVTVPSMPVGEVWNVRLALTGDEDEVYTFADRAAAHIYATSTFKAAIGGVQISTNTGEALNLGSYLFNWYEVGGMLFREGATQLPNGRYDTWDSKGGYSPVTFRYWNGQDAGSAKTNVTASYDSSTNNYMLRLQPKKNFTYELAPVISNTNTQVVTKYQGTEANDYDDTKTNNSYPRDFQNEGVQFKLDVNGMQPVKHISDLSKMNLGVYNNPPPSGSDNRVKVGDTFNIPITVAIGTRVTNLTLADGTVYATLGTPNMVGSVTYYPLTGVKETKTSEYSVTLSYKPGTITMENPLGDTYTASTSYQVYKDPFVIFDIGDTSKGGKWTSGKLKPGETPDNRSVERRLQYENTSLALADIPTVDMPAGSQYMFVGYQLSRNGSVIGLVDPSTYKLKKYDKLIAIYEMDLVGNADPVTGTDGPDGIPDRYQMKFQFKPSTGGTISIGGNSYTNSRSYVFYKLRAKNPDSWILSSSLYPDAQKNPQNWDMNAYITIGINEIPAMTADLYYTEGGWKQTIPSSSSIFSSRSLSIRSYSGAGVPKTYEFTAQFVHDEVYVRFLPSTYLDTVPGAADAGSDAAALVNRDSTGMVSASRANYDVLKGSSVTDTMLKASSTVRRSDTKYGYTFAGWYQLGGIEGTDPLDNSHAGADLLPMGTTGNYVSGRKVASTDEELKSLALTGNVYLIPLFTRNSYSVNFAIKDGSDSALTQDDNGNSISAVGTQTLLYQQTVPNVPTHTANNTGLYAFAYWSYTMNSSTGVHTAVTNDPASVPITGDTTFTAVFYAAPYLAYGTTDGFGSGRAGHYMLNAPGVFLPQTGATDAYIFDKNGSYDHLLNKNYHGVVEFSSANKYRIETVTVRVSKSVNGVLNTEDFVIMANETEDPVRLSQLEALTNADNTPFFSDVSFTVNHLANNDTAVLRLADIGGTNGDKPAMGIQVLVQHRLRTHTVTYEGVQAAAGTDPELRGTLQNSASGFVADSYDNDPAKTSGQQAKKIYMHNTVGIGTPDVTAPAGYAFMYWMDGNQILLPADLATLTVTSDRTIRAKYGKDENGDGIADGYQVKFTYRILKDDLDDGKRFDHAAGVDSTNPSYDEYTEYITRTVDENGNFSDSNSAFPAVSNDAVALGNFSFRGWGYQVDSQGVVKATAVLRTLAFTADTIFTADFGRTHWNVEYLVDPAKGSIPIGQETERVAVNGSPRAVPTVAEATGFQFAGWAKVTVPPNLQLLNPRLQTITENTKFLAMMLSEGTVTSRDDVILKGHGFVKAYEERNLSVQDILTSAEAEAWTIGNGTILTGDIQIEDSIVRQIQNTGVSGGIYNVTLTVSHPDTGAVVTRTIVVVILGKQTVTDEGTSEGKDQLAITASGFSRTLDEAHGLTQDDALLLSGAQAYLVESGIPVTNITADNAGMDAIHNAAASGGIFELTFTATADDGRTASVAVKVAVAGENTFVEQNGDHTLAIEAYGFTRTVDEARALNLTDSKSLSGVEAYRVETGERLDNIQFADNAQADTIRAVGAEGGVYDLTFRAYDIGSRSRATDGAGNRYLDKTVKVVVEGSQTGTDKTPDKADLGLKAQGFVKPEGTLNEEDAKTLGNAEAWYVQTGTAVDRSRITADQIQLDAINAAGPSGGIFDLTYTVTDDGRTVSVTVKVAVGGSSINVDQDGEYTLAIEAYGFTRTVEEAKTLNLEDSRNLAGTKAYRIETGEMLEDIRLADSAEMASIHAAGEDGGVYNLTFRAYDIGSNARAVDGAGNRYLDKTVMVVVEGSQTGTDNQPGQEDLALKAHSFTKPDGTLSAEDAKNLGNANAWYVQSGSAVDGSKITVDQAQLDAVNAAGPEGGIFDLTYTVTDNGRTVSVTVKVAVTGTNVEIEEGSDFTLAIRAYGFARTIEEAKALNLADSIRLSRVDAFCLETGEKLEDISFADSRQLDMIHAVGERGGIFDLTFKATAQNGEAVSKTVKVAVSGDTTMVDKDGAYTLAIRAYGFTRTVEEAGILDFSVSRELSKVEAYRIETGEKLMNLQFANDTELDAIHAVGPDGGIYGLTFRAYDLESTTRYLDKTVNVVVEGSQIGTDKVNLALKAQGFVKPEGILTGERAKTLGFAQAWYVQTGAPVDSFRITADQTQLDAINAAGPEGGIFDLTYTVTEDGSTASVTVKVTVPGVSTPVPDPDKPDSITITAKSFELEYEQAKNLSAAQANDLGRAKAYVLINGIDISRDITNDSVQLEAIRQTGVNGGIFPLTYQVSRNDETVSTQVLVVVKGREGSGGTTDPSETPDGVDRIAISAHDFTIGSGEAKGLQEAAAKSLAGTSAWLIDSQRDITADVLVSNSYQINLIRRGMGGKYPLTFAVTHEGVKAEVTIVVTVIPDQVSGGGSGGGSGSGGGGGVIPTKPIIPAAPPLDTTTLPDQLPPMGSIEDTMSPAGLGQLPKVGDASKNLKNMGLWLASSLMLLAVALQKRKKDSDTED